MSSHVTILHAAARAGDVELFEETLLARNASVKKPRATLPTLIKAIFATGEKNKSKKQDRTVPLLRALVKHTPAYQSSGPPDVFYYHALEKGLFADVLRWLAREYPDDQKNQHAMFDRALAPHRTENYEHRVRALVDISGFRLPPGLISDAAQRHQSEDKRPSDSFLAWAIAHVPVDERPNAYLGQALGYIKLQTLQALRSDGYSWGAVTYEDLVKEGRVDLLEWMHATDEKDDGQRPPMINKNSLCDNSRCLNRVLRTAGSYGTLTFLYESARMRISDTYRIVYDNEIADAACKAYWREHEFRWRSGQFASAS